MWGLSFFVAPQPRHLGDPPSGSWCISLSLMETSPPTYINSRLVISAVQSSPLPNSSSSTDPPSPKRGPSSPFRTSSNPLNKPKNPDISIRLKSREQLEVARGRHYSGRQIVIALEESLAGSNLQYGWVEQSFLYELFWHLISFQEQPLHCVWRETESALRSETGKARQRRRLHYLLIYCRTLIPYYLIWGIS